MDSVLSDNQFCKELAANFPEPVFVTDEEGIVVYANRCAAELLGLPSAQALEGADMFAFVEAKEREEARIDLAKRKEGTRTGPVRFHLSGKNGTPIPVMIHVAGVGNPGAFQGLRIVAVDLRPVEKIEQELRESERKYRTLFEQNTYGVFFQRADGELVDVNARALELFGLTKDQFIGRTSLHPEWRVIREDGSDCPAEEHPSMIALRTGKPALGKIRGVFNPEIDDFVWLKVDAVPLFREGEEKPYQVFGTVSDVTKQREAKSALKKSEAQYRSLFENMINGFALHEIVLDENNNPKDYVFLEANEAFEKLTGLHAKKIIGRCVTEVLPGIENDPADWIGRYGKVALTGAATRFEQHSEPMDKWFSVSTYSPAPGQFATIFEDITDRKNAESLLRRSEEKFHTLFFTSPFGICLSAVETGRILEANDAFCAMTGYTRTELIGNTSIAADFWSGRGDRNSALKKLLTEDRPVEGEFVFPGKGGRQLDVICISRIILVDDEQCILSSFNDVTRTRTLEAQLQQSQKMESVGRLAGGVAHDFNNMLSVILGQGEMALEDVPPNTPLYENLSEIQKAAERSADLTRQLLAFARKQTVVPKVLDLNESVEGLTGMLRRLIGENLTFEWKPAAAPCLIHMDPSQLDQILANLCINARDAVKERGLISIRVDAVRIEEAPIDPKRPMLPGEYVLLEVSDTGSGMDAETLSNVFEPFFTTKGVGEGTGLGLSTIYGIVKQNSGYIFVDSTVGRGTTFQIFLPRYTGKDERMTAPKAVSPQQGAETILLVEDDPSVLRMTALMLEKNGYRVLSTHRPVDALSKAEHYRGPIHLVVSDVVMPQLNGRQLVEKLRAIRPEMKHLYISGYTADVLSPKGVLDQEIDFIEKPYTRQQLVEKVQAILSRREG